MGRVEGGSWWEELEVLMGRNGGVEGGSWWEELEVLMGRNGESRGRKLVGRIRGASGKEWGS